MNLQTVTPRDIRDQAERVMGLVGPTLTSLACGLPDRKIPQRWIDGTVTPDDDELRRLAVCDEVLLLVAEGEGDDVARTWFNGSSCGPNGSQTPARAIRVDNFEYARSSAMRLIEGDGAGY